MSEPASDRKFGKYELLAHMATGGMADIFLARQTGIAGFEKLLVVKRILTHLAREEFFVKMFLDEARIAARLNHQNVVQTYDLGCENNQYFIAMEYLEGESLAELMRTIFKMGEKIPPYLVAGIMLQTCDGLHHAHSLVGPDGKPMNLVHRDVTPQNIFVLYTGGVKLMDFGIAKATHRSSYTTTGTLKGKFRYMSPEQVKNLPLDARSDIFSSGVVLWEMLTGRRLFHQTSELEILTAIAKEDAPPPSSINPQVPWDLDAIALKALNRSRELRYQSAAEMRMDLSQLVKKAKEPCDTVAVGEFVRWLFFDRMVEKQLLVKKAQTRGGDLAESLFGDLETEDSDADTIPPDAADPPSKPHPRPEGATPTPSPQPPSRGERWKIFALSAAGTIFIGLAVVLLFWKDEQKTEQPYTPLPPPMFQHVTPEPPPPARADPIAPPELPPLVEPEPVAPSEPEAAKKHGIKKPRKPRKPKKPRKPRKPAAAKAPGKLRLATVPWTEVYWGKKKLGITPLVDIELPPGRHTLRVVNPEKGLQREIVVEIRPEQTTVKRVRF